MSRRLQRKCLSPVFVQSGHGNRKKSASILMLQLAAGHRRGTRVRRKPEQCADARVQNESTNCRPDCRSWWSRRHDCEEENSHRAAVGRGLSSCHTVASPEDQGFLSDGESRRGSFCVRRQWAFRTVTHCTLQKSAILQASPTALIQIDSGHADRECEPSPRPAPTAERNITIWTRNVAAHRTNSRSSAMPSCVLAVTPPLPTI